MRFFSKLIIVLIIIIYQTDLYAQGNKPQPVKPIKHTIHDSAALQKAIRKLYTPDYIEFKNKIMDDFPNAKPGKFGQFITGINEKLNTNDKVIAFTFDGCGGYGSGYNAALINYLRKEHVPATLFITGLWIDANKKTFLRLAADSLFEIENHGLNHRLCSVDGASAYGIIGTQNVGEVIDEMELNARKIEKLTGRRPKFFRSATAYTDETCIKIASLLNLKLVNYSDLPGDAVPCTPAKVLSENLMKQIKPGAIVLMHFNHPQWEELQTMEIVVPKLREMGYKFVLLKDYSLKGMNDK
jgi:peptidoglycan/xylan/chitin deacetylase (PgdA/CDA1 family)